MFANSVVESSNNVCEIDSLLYECLTDSSSGEDDVFYDTNFQIEAAYFNELECLTDSSSGEDDVFYDTNFQIEAVHFNELDFLPEFSKEGNKASEHSNVDLPADNIPNLSSNGELHGEDNSLQEVTNIENLIGPPSEEDDVYFATDSQTVADYLNGFDFIPGLSEEEDNVELAANKIPNLSSDEERSRDEVNTRQYETHTESIATFLDDLPSLDITDYAPTLCPTVFEREEKAKLREICLRKLNGMNREETLYKWVPIVNTIRSLDTHEDKEITSTNEIVGTISHTELEKIFRDISGPLSDLDNTDYAPSLCPNEFEREEKAKLRNISCYKLTGINMEESLPKWVQIVNTIRKLDAQVDIATTNEICNNNSEANVKNIFTDISSSSDSHKDEPLPKRPKIDHE